MQLKQVVSRHLENVRMTDDHKTSARFLGRPIGINSATSALLWHIRRGNLRSRIARMDYKFLPQEPVWSLWRPSTRFINLRGQRFAENSLRPNFPLRHYSVTNHWQMSPEEKYILRDGSRVHHRRQEHNNYKLMQKAFHLLLRRTGSRRQNRFRGLPKSSITKPRKQRCPLLSTDCQRPSSGHAFGQRRVQALDDAFSTGEALPAACRKEV